MPTGYGAFCAGGGPGRKELFFSSLAPSHKKPRALPGITPLAPLRKTLSQAHGCLAILAFPLYGSNWQHLSLQHFPLAQEMVRRVLKSTGRLAEEVSCELLQLLGRRFAGLFPAWIKRAASSKEEAHKGKNVFCIRWDSPIKSNTTSSFCCLYNYFCMLWLGLKTKQKNRTPHHVDPCPLGSGSIPPKDVHMHQERENKGIQELFGYSEAQKLCAALTLCPDALCPSARLS